MHLHKTYNLMKSRWAVASLLLLILQQIIVASSTYWLTRLMQDVDSGVSVWTHLSLFLGSLTLPYFPAGAALILMSFWKQEALKRFIEQFVAVHQHQIGFWTDKTERESRIAMLTTEGQNTLNEFITYLHDFVACSLNVGLNILVLSLLIEPRYAISYGISLVLVALMLKLQAHKQGELAARAQTERVRLGQTLLSAWDNVLIGNVYNLKLWLNKTWQRFGVASQSNIHADVFQKSVGIGIALVTLIPTLMVVVSSVHAHLGDKIWLSSLVVTFPRLFMILNYTTEALLFGFAWTTHKNKLVGVQKFLELPASGDLHQRIRWEKIQVSVDQISQNICSVEDLLVLADQPGRITLRGDNGAGKSSLLMLLHRHLNGKSFYLPAQHHLEFESNAHGKSMGQGLRARFDELKSKGVEGVLLLDEWDANLDAANQTEISKAIDALAANRCVIEVRHRR